MKNLLVLATAATLSAFTAQAYAGDNDGAVKGAAGGAITGAVIGGPVGAVIGGAVGMAAGAAIDPPPPKVITYVREQPMPEKRVMIQEELTIGHKLPREVVLTPIPEDETYAYAVVNNHRVIVDPQTNTVVQVLD
jgi:hypothetical protein